MAGALCDAPPRRPALGRVRRADAPLGCAHGRRGARGALCEQLRARRRDGGEAAGGAGSGRDGCDLYTRRCLSPPLPVQAHPSTRFTLILPGGAQLLVPAAASPAVDIPSGAFFAWPVGLPMPWQQQQQQPPAAGPDAVVALTYALAQPLGFVAGATAADASSLLLGQTAGIPVEVCFAAAASLTVLHCAGSCSVEGGSLFARALPPGLGPALSLRLPSGRLLDVIVLDETSGADRLWFGELGGARRAFVAEPGSRTILQFQPADPRSLTLVAVAGPVASSAQLAILPPPATLSVAGVPLPGQPAGAFTAYAVPVPAVTAAVSATLVRPGSLPPRVLPGPRGGAASPGLDGTLTGWDAAGVWTLAFDPPLAPGALPPGADARLCVNYTGDAARLYANASDAAPCELPV